MPALKVPAPKIPVPKMPAPKDSDSSQDLSALAYSLWMERGCPEGSPDEDWYRAEALLAESQRK